VGTQRLVWLPLEGWLQFDAAAAYGEPVRLGGDPEGKGAKPSDLLPLSLVACTAYDVVEILRKQRQEMVAMEVIVDSEQDPDPPWIFRSIHMHWVATGSVDQTKLDKAIHLAETKYCAVAATIAPVVELSSSSEVQPA
jgi:putative redox protein